LKIAIICPDDISVVLFCKGIIKQIRYYNYEIFVLSDKFLDNSEYVEKIESWGCQHRLVKFYRFISPVRDLKYIYSLNKIMKKEKFDIVFNISTKPNIYGGIIASWNRVDKIICAVWGFGITITKKEKVKDKIVFLIFKYLYRYSFNKSDKIWFTNPNYDKIGLINKEKNEEKIILTKNYVDTDDYSMEAVDSSELPKLRKELGLKKNSKVVVMVSRMSWTKGVNEFIEAAELISKQKEDIHFILVGPLDLGSPDAIEEEYILERVNKIKKLQWLGFRGDTINLYAVSSLAVYPTYYPEGGYPRGITEPMSLGKPVIATNNENCKNTIDNDINGILVSERDSRALADAILRLFNTPNLIETFGINSRKKVLNEFDEKTIISELINKLELS